MDMNRTLHDTNNAQRILKLTADTMLLVDKNGVCIDIDPHCDLWFLQDEILLGKNIFELLPEYTRERVVPVFQSVLEGKKSVSKNFKLVLKEDVYYFKCIMHPYDDMVLCQYRDITQRSNVKRQLEQTNRTLREIQKQGTAILMVTSSVSDTMDISDRLLVVEQGKVAASYDRSEFKRIVR